MNMKFEDWNKSLNYADEIIKPYDFIKAFEYIMCDGRKGIVFRLIDNHGKTFKECYSGIKNSFEEMKMAIDNCVNILREDERGDYYD